MTVRPTGQPERSRFSGQELEAYDWVVQREANRGEATPDGQVNAYYGSLLWAPEVCYHISALGKLARLTGERDDSFSHADREWVNQVLSLEIGSTVVLGGHLEDAVYQGVRAEAIKALREGRDEDLSPDERLLAKYIRQVYHGQVDDETYAAMEARSGKRGVVEYTSWILFLHLTIRLIEALTGGRGPSDEDLMAKINAYITGAQPIPDAPVFHAG